MRKHPLDRLDSRTYLRIFNTARTAFERGKANPNPYSKRSQYWEWTTWREGCDVARYSLAGTELEYLMIFKKQIGQGAKT